MSSRSLPLVANQAILMNNNKLLGRSSDDSLPAGDAEEISVGSGLTLQAGVLTASGGGGGGLPQDPLNATHGGTGIDNNVASTITISGAHSITFVVGADTSITLPASGTLATQAYADAVNYKRTVFWGASTDAVAVVSPAKTFPIPSAWNGLNITAITARVSQAGTTNATTLDVKRNRAGTQHTVLTADISIASGGSSANGSIDTNFDDLQTGDWLEIYVDSVSTTPPKGASVEITVG